MMYEYYCETCKKWCDKEEVELEEVFEGDWEEVHVTCNSMLRVFPTGILNISN